MSATHRPLCSELKILPRCGDLVRHRTSGITMTVAWAEGGMLAWDGLPSGAGPLSDFVLIRSCTDKEHTTEVNRWRTEENDWRQPEILRLYGG